MLCTSRLTAKALGCSGWLLRLSVVSGCSGRYSGWSPQGRLSVVAVVATVVHGYSGQLMATVVGHNGWCR